MTSGEIRFSPRLSPFSLAEELRRERIDSCLSARASLDRLVSAIAETRKGCAA